MTNNNTTLRQLLDKDLNDLHHTRNMRGSNRDNTYKYGNDNNQKVVEGDIPEWAQKALSNPKPGETVGQYSQNDLRNKLNTKE